MDGYNTPQHGMAIAAITSIPKPADICHPKKIGADLEPWPPWSNHVNHAPILYAYARVCLSLSLCIYIYVYMYICTYIIYL